MFSAVATNRAGTRRVPWVNQDHGHSCTPSFVEDKLLQLIEAPVSKLKTHLLGETVTSLPDTAKVFKSECLPKRNRSFDKPAADVVVHPASEPQLTAAQPLKVALGRLRTTFLKPRTKSSQGATNLANRLSTVLISLAVRGNLHHAKVNTNRAVDGAKGRVLRVANRHQIKLPIHENEIGFSPLPLKKFGLVLPASEGDIFPACDGPDAYLLLVQHVSQDSGVIRDGSVRAKGAGSDQRRAWAPLREPVTFVGISHFGKEQCNDLSRQSCACANGFVPLMVQIKAFESLRGKRTFRNSVSRLICGFQRFSKGVSLLWTGQEFDLRNEFHCPHSIKQKSNIQERARATRSLRQTGVTLLPGTLWVLKAWKGFRVTVFSMKRYLAALALGLISATAFAQELSAEAKSRTLQALKTTIAQRAFVPGVDFSKLPAALDKRKSELDRATDQRSFANAVNLALRDFGISHIRFLTATAARQRATGQALGFGLLAQPVESGLTVANVAPGSGAAGVGLSVGDTIIEVEGQPNPTPLELEQGGVRPAS